MLYVNYVSIRWRKILLVLSCSLVILIEANFALLFPGHLAMSGDIFGTTGTGTVLLAYSVESRDPAKHPIMHKSGPHKKELSGLKCQLCGD